MGSTSWLDNILQALLIGLVVQIIVSILSVLCASIWASFKERMDRSATGESMTEADMEMGTVNVGEVAAIRGVGDDGKLGNTEDITMRANTPEAQIPATDHPPKSQCKTVSEDERRATVPAVASLKLQILLQYRTSKAPVGQGVDRVVADLTPVQLLVTGSKGVAPH